MRRDQVAAKSAWTVGLLMGALCGVPAVEAADAKATASFSVDSVTTLRDIEGDRVYVEGCILRTEAAGKPDLPARLYRLVIPRDLRVAEVRVIRAEFEAVAPPDGRFDIPPALPPIPTDGSVEPEPVKPDRAIYGRDDPFPASPVQLLDDGYSFGYHLVSLLIHPVRYHPVSGRLELLTRLDFEVTGPKAEAPHFYAVRRSERSAAVVDHTITRLVDNDDEIRAFAPPTRIERLSDWSGRMATERWPSLEGRPVDYVMITGNTLAATFEPLAEWKRAKGWNTVIRTVFDIANNYPGVDTQERIRNFIIESGELWGTTHVLLAGDTNQVPDRKGFWDWHTHEYGPTDLYYATAEGNWNPNGNAIFGEYDEEVDESIDFHVGRAPVEDVAEADTFVQKVLAYEQAPPAQFVETALLMGASIGSGNDLWGQTCKETIAGYLPGRFDVWRLYNVLNDGDELLTRESALTHLDMGYHYINHADHSGPYSMGTGSKHGGRSVDSIDVAGLTNGHSQGVLFSLGCSPNYFDGDSISEEFLNHPNGGTVAYMGNTRTGWSSQTPQDIAFFRKVFADGVTCLGEAFSIARVVFQGNNYWEKYYRRVMNLLGDPEMPLWTEEPLPMLVYHPPGFTTGTQNVTIDVTEWSLLVPVVGAHVCLYKEDEVYAVGSTGPDGRVTTEITCDTAGTLLFTVTAPNHLPYQVVLPVITALPPQLYVSGFYIDDDEDGRSDGNDDGLPDMGETLELSLHVTNGGGATASSIAVTLSSLTPEVVVLGGLAFCCDIRPGETVTHEFVVAIEAGPAETLATLEAGMMSPQSSGSQPFTDTFWFTAHAPDLHVNGSIIIDDWWSGSGQGNGDGDGIPELGETIELYVGLRNTGHGAARDVSASVSSDHEHLIVRDRESDFGDIAAMGTALALDRVDPIVVYISPLFQGDETLTLVVSDHYTERGTFTLDLVAPPAPTSLDFESGAWYIDLTWDPVAVDDLLGYYVYRSDSPDGPFERRNSVLQVGCSSYRDEIWFVPADFEGIFYYYVTAVDESGNEGPPSAILEAWLTYPQHAGWPVRLGPGGLIYRAAAVADVDDDGTKEIFVGALDGKIYGFYHDGTELFDLDGDPTTVSGFAELEGTGGIWGAPAIGDLDRDGSLDVITTSRKAAEDKVYAWSVFDEDEDGAPDPVPGWPVDLGGAGTGWSLSSPALGDIDRDGCLEVVFTTEGQGGKVHVIDGRGFEQNGWPQSGLGNWTYATPALADLDTDGYLEIIVGGADGNIYAWDHTGILLPGWPFATNDAIDSSPAVGDIDGDGSLEILQNSHDGYLYALKTDGTEAPGWEGGKPYTPGGGVLSSPALADVLGDSRPEVFLATADGVSAWSPDGTPLPGWPVSLTPDRGTMSSPAIADIDGDDHFEILVGWGDHRMYVLEEDGQVAAHWPAPAGEWVMASPTVDDLDHDGDLEVIVGAGYRLHVWDCVDPPVTPAGSGTIEWGTFHANVQRTGRYEP